MTHSMPLSDGGLVCVMPVAFLDEGFLGWFPGCFGSFRCLPLSAFGVGEWSVLLGGTSPISAIQFVSVVFTCSCLQFIKLSTPRDKMATSQLDHSTLFGEWLHRRKSAAPDARSLQDPAKDPRLKMSGSTGVRTADLCFQSRQC